MQARTYEILFIADPNLGEPEVDALTTQVEGYVEKEGGKIQKVEKWGKKRLAFVVKKHREGYYVLLVVDGSSALVHEVERRLRVTEGIIRHLAVRIDDDLRKAERSKALRDAAAAKARPRKAETAPQRSEFGDDDDAEEVRL
jgi:small subunit ribosomal protein S6